MQYLTKHANGTYYIRIRVPKDLQSTLKRSEILRSLHTMCKNKAKRRCYAMTAHTLSCFERARGTNMSWKEIKEELSSTFQMIVEEEKQYLNQYGPKSDSRLNELRSFSKDYSDLSDLARSTGDIQDILPYINTSRDHVHLNERLQRELERLGSSDFDSMTYAEVMNMLSNFYDQAIKLHLDARTYGLKDTPTPSNSSVTLTAAFAKYKSEKKKANSWTVKTAKEIEPPFNDFKEAFGDLKVNQLTKATAVEFKDILSNIPRNLTQIRDTRFPDKNIREISQLTHDKVISPKTVNKKLGFLRTFIGWCVSNGYCSENHFDNVKTLTSKRKTREDRDAFNREEMNIILDAAKQENDNWKKLVVYIAAYNGLRLNEICQLYQDDIIEEDGIWCFRITDKREDQHLKTQNSKRIIPIHQSVLDLNLLSIAANPANQRLFPEFRLTDNNYGDKAGRWFNRTFLKNLGLKTPKKVYHSLRHTFITELKQNQTAEPIAKAIAGHIEQSITYSRYGGEYRLETLRDEINKVRYGSEN